MIPCLRNTTVIRPRTITGLLLVQLHYYRWYRTIPVVEVEQGAAPPERRRAHAGPGADLVQAAVAVVQDPSEKTRKNAYMESFI